MQIYNGLIIYFNSPARKWNLHWQPAGLRSGIWWRTWGKEAPILDNLEDTIKALKAQHDMTPEEESELRLRMAEMEKE